MISPILILFGASLGISMAAPPGPITAMIIQKSKTSSRSGFVVGLGAMTADFSLMLMVIILRNTVNLHPFYNLLYFVGGAYFIFLGISIIKKINKPIEPDLSEDTSKNGYFLGLFAGIFNPMQIGWWLTAGISILNAQGIVPFVFFYPGIALYLLVFTPLIYKSYGKWGESFEKGASVFSTIILFSFGFYFLLLLTQNLNLINVMQL